MSETLALARLTLREASRRKLLLALGVLTLIAIGVTTWGFSRIPGTTIDHRPIAPIEVRAYTSQLLILTTFMFSFVLGLAAVFVAALSIAGDVDSGVALALLSRPVGRSHFVLGKWLGLALLIVGYTAVAMAVELLAVSAVTGYAPPDPVGVIIYLCVEGVCLLTMATLLGTRLAPMTSGVIGIAAFGACWLGGVVGGIGAAIGNETVANIGVFSRLLLPSDGIWRGAIHSLEPAGIIATEAQLGRVSSANPFFAGSAPTSAYLVWVAAWLLAVLLLSLASFRSREL